MKAAATHGRHQKIGADLAKARKAGFFISGVGWQRRSTKKGGDTMRTVLRSVILGFALAFAASITSVSAQQEGASGMGTWKLNVGKSKYSPGPPPKSFTAKFEPAGKGVKATTEGVSADGKPTSTEYTANWDGKDVPIKGSPVADTVSLRRVDANTTVRTDMKAGKVVQTLTRAIAKDGKTFTVTIKGTNAKGEPVNHLLLFEKQ